jgi:hypothetical protein
MSVLQRKPMLESEEPAPGRITGEFAMQNSVDATVSRLDLILTSPLLTAACLDSESPPPGAGPWKLKATRVRIRSWSACAALRRSIASVFALKPSQSAGEFKTVLTFSLGGLAVSLQLAAQAKAAGLDEVLTAILLQSS